MGIRLNCFSAVAAASLLCAPPLGAQGFPERPIRIVVPFTAGGGVDFVGRQLASRLRDALKQPVIVDNRPGAGGNIAAALVAKAAPDGYTILLGSAALTVNATLHRNLTYDLLKDFSAISLLTSSPQLLVVHPTVPAMSVADLIRLARKKPGELTFASAGVGGAPHLSGELFKQHAGVSMRHIPYKGGGAAMIDVMGGQVDMYFSSVTGAMTQVKAGKLRGLGVTGTTRLSMLPDIPTIAEAGLPGYQAGNWYAFLAPTGTPTGVIERLNSETIKALHSSELNGVLQKQAYEVHGSSPSELQKFMAAEVEKNAKLIKAANIRAD